jgi:hypothetical protein
MCILTLSCKEQPDKTDRHLSCGVSSQESDYTIIGNTLTYIYEFRERGERESSCCDLVILQQKDYWYTTVDVKYPLSFLFGLFCNCYWPTYKPLSPEPLFTCNIWHLNIYMYQCHILFSLGSPSSRGGGHKLVLWYLFLLFIRLDCAHYQATICSALCIYNEQTQHYL